MPVYAERLHLFYWHHVACFSVCLPDRPLSIATNILEEWFTWWVVSVKRNCSASETVCYCYSMMYSIANWVYFKCVLFAMIWKPSKRLRQFTVLMTSCSGVNYVVCFIDRYNLVFWWDVDRTLIEPLGAFHVLWTWLHVRKNTAFILLTWSCGMYILLGMHTCIDKDTHAHTCAHIVQRRKRTFTWWVVKRSHTHTLFCFQQYWLKISLLLLHDVMRFDITYMCFYSYNSCSVVAYWSDKLYYIKTILGKLHMLIERIV